MKNIIAKIKTVFGKLLEKEMWFLIVWYANHHANGVDDVIHRCNNIISFALRDESTTNRILLK